MLQGEVSSWIKDQAPAVSQQGDPKTGWWLWQLKTSGTSPPVRWSVVVGEIIHDLRSALDHLVCQLAIANQNSATMGHQFPIFCVFR
jgi:hypothetical protein